MITPGNHGANVTWNFQSLHANHDTIKVKVVSPSIIPAHTFFPAANLAIIYDSAVNMYFFNRSAAGLVLHGTIYDFFNSDDSIRVTLTTPDTVLALPGVYGDSAYRYSFGDTKSRCSYYYDTNFNGFPVSVPIDTVRIKHSQYKTDVIDSWGTMNTPTSSFPALRQKNTTYSTDSIWGYANVPAPYQSYSGWYFLISRKDTTLMYTWWTKNFGYPALKMTMVPHYPNVAFNVEWAHDVPTVGIEENEWMNTAVFPNPATDYITISNIGGFSELVIYGAAGNEISRQNIKNNDLVKVSVQHLANGLYFYNAVNAGKKTSGKFVVKH